MALTKQKAVVSVGEAYKGHYFIVTCHKRLRIEDWEEWQREVETTVSSSKYKTLHIVSIVGQLEKCPSTGKLHAQIAICFAGKPRYSQVRDLLAYKDGGYPHVEGMRGTPKDLYAYVTKEDTRVLLAEGGWNLEVGNFLKQSSNQGRRTDCHSVLELLEDGKSDLEIVRAVPPAMKMFSGIDRLRMMISEEKEKPMESIVLRPWQTTFLEHLQGPVISRRIFWVWSPLSGVGKTTTMRYFDAKMLVSILPVTGSSALANILYAYQQHKVIWFDLSRDTPVEGMLRENLEQLSNCGPMLSTKYASVKKWVTAHIVVTSNREPPLQLLPKRILPVYIGADGNHAPDPSFTDEVYDEYGWIAPPEPETPAVSDVIDLTQ